MVADLQQTGFFFRKLDQLYDALIDPARRERAAIGTLAAYLLLWTLYAVIAKSSQDIHGDMAELIVWSRDLAFGFRKHPPLAAIVVNFWFHIFPIADWSYYLLSVLTATLTLWTAWLLSADYLNAEKRVIGIALLTLIPFFNFLALTFNVNTILMPLWAATTLWFLRSFKTKSIVYAALAGVGAAACLYGKYWSIFLLFGLGIAALMHAERAKYFRSRAPWVTSIVCVLILIPHIDWLMEHDFVPFTYAISVHGDKSFSVERSAQ
jgi:4-amino-4-deoxy-L-arabinose transferase-like glycosyltransferase